jgi:hypothetical protein
MIISSFFTLNAVPAVGLTPLPTLLIWEVNGVTETLVVPSAPMTEVGSGFYQYLFSSYDPSKEYVFRVDGGSTYVNDNPERYQAGSIQVATVTNSTVVDIASQVWDQSAAAHVGAGTMGLVQNQIKADTTAIAANLYVNANSVLDLVQLLLKYDTNRTKIDPVSCTLTIYEDDCVTPLRVFQLLDTTNSPSIQQVAERKPISANDGLPVC